MPLFMRKLIALVAFIGLTSVAFAQNTTSGSASPETTSNTFFVALQNEDSGAMTKILADDFQITAADGQSADKELMGQALSGGYLVVDTATPSNVKSRMIGTATSVVSGVLKFKGSLQSQAFDNKVAFTVVTTKQGDTWKVSDVRLIAVQ